MIIIVLSNLTDFPGDQTLPLLRLASKMGGFADQDFVRAISYAVFAELYRRQGAVEAARYYLREALALEVSLVLARVGRFGLGGTELIKLLGSEFVQNSVRIQERFAYDDLLVFFRSAEITYEEFSTFSE